MAQIQKGTTYITGDQVTAANLNALADSAILLPGAITDQTAKTVPLAADTVLIHSAADTALRKSTLTQLFANATGIPLTTGVTGILPAANGGTGVANASTITIAGNVTHAGAFTQSFTATANTALTLPTTGTLSTLAGAETLTNKTLTSPTLTAPVLGTPASGTVTNLTGTASININGTVGATTANTGAFTTLSTTGTNGLTANGNASETVNPQQLVVYGNAKANGSGTVVVGSSYNVSTIAEAAAAKAYFGFIRNDANGRGDFVWYNDNTNDTSVFTTADEVMRLTKTGLVGIGTTSPSAKLSISGGNIVFDTDGNRSIGWGGNTNVAAANALIYSDGNFVNINSKAGSALYLNFDNANSASTVNIFNGKMIVQQAGNVGIGVTPSAWGTNYKATQIGTAGVLYANTNANTVGLICNAYGTNASDNYITNGVATRYYQFSGSHYWDYAASGTAGNAVSFSTKMTLDTNGNLGIGTSSPATALHVLSGTDADDGNIRIESSGNTAGATFYSPSHASASSRNWGFFNNYNAAGYFELLVSTSKTNAPTVTLFRADTTGLAVTGTGYFSGGVTINNSGLLINNSGGLTVSGPTALTGALSVSTKTTTATFAMTTSGTKTGTSGGTAGDVSWDADYIYMCIGTNNWRRVQIVAF